MEVVRCQCMNMYSTCGGRDWLFVTATPERHLPTLQPPQRRVDTSIRIKATPSHVPSSINYGYPALKPFHFEVSTVHESPTATAAFLELQSPVSVADNASDNMRMNKELPLLTRDTYAVQRIRAVLLARYTKLCRRDL